MDYVLHIAVLVGIYVAVATSLDLLAGQTGLVSLCHAAFFGIGAYTASLLMLRSGMPFLLCAVGGMVLAALLSLVVSVPSLRLRDDYFVIATLGFQLIAFSVLNNWTGITRGSIGLTEIPAASLFGVVIQSRGAWVLVSFTCAALSLGVATLIVRSPFGRVLRAIREDEAFAQSLGKNTVACKVLIFSVSAALAGGAGAAYGSYMGAINPASFTIMDSVMVLSMVIIGGAGRLTGAGVGAFLLIAMPEALRFTQVSNVTAANLRQIFYGGGMMLLMFFRPQGLIGRYSFRR